MSENSELLAPARRGLRFFTPGVYAARRHEDLFEAERELSMGWARAQKHRADDDWEGYVKNRAEKSCGLKIYKEAGIAVQPVRGVLADGCGPLWECYGCFDTSRIQRAVRAVRGMREIRALVFDFDTPGGYASGVQEAAEMMESLPDDRPDCMTVAYVSRMACSGGAWLSAGCQHVFAAPSATLGSVGVFAAIFDVSRMYEEEGIETILAVDGKYKAMGFPGVPVSEAQRAWLLNGVMETSAEFKGYMTRRRNVSEESMQGQTFSARKAPAGYCDGTQFGDLEDCVAAIVEAQKTARQG